MSLPESPDNILGITINKAIPVFSGLGCPEIHSPRHSYCRIRISTAQFKRRIGSLQGIDIFHPIFSGCPSLRKKGLCGPWRKRWVLILLSSAGIRARQRQTSTSHAPASGRPAGADGIRHPRPGRNSPSASRNRRDRAARLRPPVHPASDEPCGGGNPVCLP